MNANKRSRKRLNVKSCLRSKKKNKHNDTFFLLEGKAVPTELRDMSKGEKEDLGYDQAQEAPTTHEDDEYARGGVYDPKILITTSRDPSSRLQQFSKEMRLVFPNSQRINRGGHVMKELVDACRANEVTDLIVLHEHRGQPGKK
jgi:U3 small nucleolar ribonucleoprotein protein IMP4